MKRNSIMVSRLSAMMFFQYMVLGTWESTLGLILSKHGLSSIIGLSYSLVGLAAIISPLFLGMLTDRFFPSQIVLGIANIIGGILLWFIPKQITLGHGTPFLILLFLYMLFYNATYSLTNNVGFSNIKDSIKSFPVIRVFGTIGFAVAGLLIGSLGFSGSPVSITIGAVSSIILGLYNFTLPHTPAPDKGKPFSLRDALCINAFSLLKNRNYLVFIICTMLLFPTYTAYTSYASVFLGDIGFTNVSSFLTIGQASEVVFMLLIPFFFRRLGFKYMFLLGMFAWVLRMLLFALGAPDAIRAFMFIALALHGCCWDFFFVSGYIYTDKIAGAKIRSQAQGFLIMFTRGVGAFIGSSVMGGLFNSMVTAQGAKALPQWEFFWIYSGAIALVASVVFFFLFKDKLNEKKVSSAA